MKKTLFLFEQGWDAPAKFFTLDGDYRHLDGCVINVSDDTAELEKLIYDEDYNIKKEFFDEPPKDWDYFVRTGFFN